MEAVSRGSVCVVWEYKVYVLPTVRSETLVGVGMEKESFHRAHIICNFLSTSKTYTMKMEISRLGSREP
jgi:hypothetical protein